MPSRGGSRVKPVARRERETAPKLGAERRRRGSEVGGFSGDCEGGAAPNLELEREGRSDACRQWCAERQMSATKRRGGSRLRECAVGAAPRSHTEGRRLAAPLMRGAEGLAKGRRGARAETGGVRLLARARTSASAGHAQGRPTRSDGGPAPARGACGGGGAGARGLWREAAFRVGRAGRVSGAQGLLGAAGGRGSRGLVAGSACGGGWAGRPSCAEGLCDRGGGAGSRRLVAGSALVDNWTGTVSGALGLLGGGVGTGSRPFHAPGALRQTCEWGAALGACVGVSQHGFVHARGTTSEGGETNAEGGGSGCVRSGGPAPRARWGGEGTGIRRNDAPGALAWGCVARRVCGRQPALLGARGGPLLGGGRRPGLVVESRSEAGGRCVAPGPCASAIAPLRIVRNAL